MAENSIPERKRVKVSFGFDETDLEIYLVCPFPLTFESAHQDVYAFSTGVPNIRIFRTVLRFLNKFSRKSKTEQILRIVERMLKKPEVAKDTLMFTEDYMFVRSSIRVEIIP